MTPPTLSDVVLVTGGSRGIGAAVALRAGRLGYRVAVNYVRDLDAAQGVVRDIERAGGTALAVKADIGNEDEVTGMYVRIDRELGPVTALVNNAGVLGPRALISAVSADTVLGVLRTNVVGSFVCAREAIRRMMPEAGGKGGAIVNISSLAGRTGGPAGFAAYAASKGAIDSLTANLAKEVGPHGIRVNAVRPGLIETDIHAALGDRDGLSSLDVLRRAAAASVPLGGRLGRPEEVAALVMWLLSAEASYVTGAVYDLTGGR